MTWLAGFSDKRLSVVMDTAGNITVLLNNLPKLYDQIIPNTLPKMCYVEYECCALKLTIYSETNRQYIPSDACAIPCRHCSEYDEERSK